MSEGGNGVPRTLGETSFGSFLSAADLIVSGSLKALPAAKPSCASRGSSVAALPQSPSKSIHGERFGFQFAGASMIKSPAITLPQFPSEILHRQQLDFLFVEASLTVTPAITFPQFPSEILHRELFDFSLADATISASSTVLQCASKIFR